MQRVRWPWLEIVVLLPALTGLMLGCELVDSPTASILPQVAATRSQDQSSVRTAVFRYETPLQALDDAASVERGPLQAADGTTASPAAAPLRRLLAIRYPHPDGRLDRARVEVVIGRLTSEATRQPRGWRGRLAAALQDASPGVSWGSGIQQAKSLDISVEELQQLASEAQTWRADGAEQVSTASNVSEPDLTASAEDHAALTIELNGETVARSGLRPEPLESLAERVLREGRLMTVRVAAANLFTNVNASSPIRLTSRQDADAAGELSTAEKNAAPRNLGDASGPLGQTLKTKKLAD